MDPHDIAATLQLLNMVVKKDDKIFICLNRKYINDFTEKVVSQKRLVLDPERLRWTPLVHTTVVVTEAKSEKEDQEKKRKQSEVEETGVVDVVKEEKTGVNSPSEDKPLEQNADSSSEDEEVVRPRKRSRKAIDESESEKESDDAAKPMDAEEEAKESEGETKEGEEDEEVPDVNGISESADLPEVEDLPAVDGTEEAEVVADGKSRSSSVSARSNASDDESSSDESDDSSSSSSSSSSDSSSSTDEGEAKSGEQKESPLFDTFRKAVKLTKDPVLTGVKEQPPELGMPAENIPEVAPGVFGLPPQESAFDLEDTPSLQDFLGGDINISTGEDLTTDSLLEQVTDGYYDETTGDDGKDLE